MENQNLRKNLEEKKDSLDSLKEEYENKLGKNQKRILGNLLFAQEQITQLENSPVISSLEDRSKEAKRNLKTKLSEDEIEKICQLQIEITKIEMELENQVETRIETPLK